MEPQGYSELAEIIEGSGADREHDRPVNAIVIVDRYVAEPDRAASDSSFSWRTSRSTRSGAR